MIQGSESQIFKAKHNSQRKKQSHAEFDRLPDTKQTINCDTRVENICMNYSVSNLLQT